MEKKISQVWVSPVNSSGWKVKKPTNTKASGVFETKKKAIRVARKIARNQNLALVVQMANGVIGDHDTHGLLG